MITQGRMEPAPRCFAHPDRAAGGSSTFDGSSAQGSETSWRGDDIADEASAAGDHGEAQNSGLLGADLVPCRSKIQVDFRPAVVLPPLRVVGSVLGGILLPRFRLAEGGHEDLRLRDTEHHERRTHGDRPGLG